MKKWVRHFYQPVLPLGEDGKLVTGSKEHIELSRKAASEGMVLLKNENETLPVKKNARVALFGKGTIDYVKGGGGSGDVTVRYIRNFYEGMKIKESEGKVSIFHELARFYEDEVNAQYADRQFPGMTKEPEIPAELLKKATDFADTAIVTISRFSGEGWDRKSPKEEIESYWEDEIRLRARQKELFPESDFYLTPEEIKMVDDVKSAFDNIIVVLNVGGVMASSWFKNDDKIGAALYAWQGGIEGGLATADLIVGDENPSAKLVDTFADSLDDYPSSYNFHDSKSYAEYTDDIYVGYRYFETIPGASSKVIYPFGYGLSYTSFDISTGKFCVDDGVISVEVNVKNTGKYAGKEVVMLYFSAPQGLLGKPARQLAAFKKTALLNPGEEESIVLSIKISDMASYDDDGKVNKSAWVLEKGTYEFFVGNCVSCAKKLDDVYEVAEDTVVLQLSEKLAPSNLTERLRADGTFEKVNNVPERKRHTIFAPMPYQEAEGAVPSERALPVRNMLSVKYIQFESVANGEVTLDDFMAQLSVDDLIHLIGGQRNQGVSNTFGLGNMPEYGIPNVSTADGPAGYRVGPDLGIYTTAWPCATMLACSFNVELAELVGKMAAREVKENNIGIWLAPAVNIHRTPMCGRNFEYYSEDPLVAGKIGAAVVKGIQSENIAATVKHFAFNNKETNRKYCDSRVSERAGREIYLKGFEIIVNEADPWCIMTGYNMVNDYQCSENKELIEGILRGDWGYKGLVMSDWWTAGEHYLEAKAGNDLKMGNGYPERVKEAYNKGEITKDEIYKAAKNVLKLILKME